MAQLIVRNLEDEVKVRLTQRAREHGRSTEEEVREILRAAALAERPAADTGARGLGSRMAGRFAGLGLDADIEEWRGEEARPADLGGA
ncbi:toxin-antitoxin system [uncultured Thiohalocapsa sp.]|uniref:FitA-like ribbon-helix-helix domain-containing protein n=1 Tax=uncultured Thiohalocapsa sp. TaxID=768990 RepID=UPI0025E794B6|nr:toxin-antitoxin system [uncultured Thiohalocapsa sp.]